MVMQETRVRDLEKAFEEDKKRIHEDYFTFLRFKSVSTEPEFKQGILDCSDWVQTFLSSIDFEVEVWQEEGHPIIFASYNGAGADKPTLLIYNHYDVQPVDPIDEWDSPPFEPTLRDGEVFARGAQDNKGQCLYTLAALRALYEEEGKYPINIKVCIEGEEEAGSASLLKLCSVKKEKLQADFLAIVDLGLKKPDAPSVSLGVRGLVALDLEVWGSHTDLHSGAHGGIVYNPIHALNELLAKFRDENGKVQVPGFYDDVIEFSDKERELICFDFDQNVYENHFGQATGGEKALSALERNWLRPTLEINGVCGGYTGDGFKTVIPSKAFAKISCRLVPGQNPEKIGKQVAQFLLENAPEGVTVKPHIHEGGGPALHASPQSAGVRAAAQAYEEVFGKPCAFTLEGGSIPVTPALAESSGAEVIFMGLGLDTDQIHAPNEHFGLDRLKKGFLSIIRFLEILGK